MSMLNVEWNEFCSALPLVKWMIVFSLITTSKFWCKSLYYIMQGSIIMKLRIIIINFLFRKRQQHQDKMCENYFLMIIKLMSREINPVINEKWCIAAIKFIIFSDMMPSICSWRGAVIFKPDIFIITGFNHK